jgi:hypothetical protein
MASFTKYFRMIFETFGYPLTRSAALPAKELSDQEKRLGVRIPTALREYYLVAGRERRFSVCHNRLLAPKNWSIDKKKLIFMEENQAVVWWAVATGSLRSGDPSVFQGVNDEPITWVREHRKCSVFVAVMLHYQAVSGGFRYFGSASSPEKVHEILKKDWRYVGELNQLWAFNRQNQVVCVTPGGGLPFQPAMMILAGGKTRSDLRAIEESLSVALED